MKDSGRVMIGHEGTVTGVSEKSVMVSISARSACSGCHAKESCNMLGSDIKTIEVKGKYNVKKGDTVDVLMQQSMGFTALFFGYVMPFFVLLTTLVIMISSGADELFAGLISIAILLPYYFAVYIFRKRISEKFTFTLKV